MKLKMKKLVSLGLVSAMSLTMLAGCGNSNGATNDTGSSKNQESKAAGDVKIGVLVQDVSGEEALGFRAYYEDYVADQYGVTFTYTDELKDAASEKSAIEKFASQGYQAVISLSSNDRALQIETCEENQIYYAVAAGNIDDATYGKIYGGLIEAGAQTVMVGHIAQPAYQKLYNPDFPDKLVPATLSPELLKGFFYKFIHFICCNMPFHLIYSISYEVFLNSISSICHAFSLLGLVLNKDYILF